MRILAIPPSRPRLVTYLNSPFTKNLFSYFRPMTFRGKVFYLFCLMFRRQISVTYKHPGLQKCLLKINLQKSLVYIGSNPDMRSLGIWRLNGLFHKVTAEKSTSIKLHAKTFDNFVIPYLISERSINGNVVQTFKAFRVGRSKVRTQEILRCWKEISDTSSSPSKRFGRKGFGHGDFSQWNIVKDKEDKIVIFDWDDSGCDQPYLVDILNYIWIRFLLHGSYIYLLKAIIDCRYLREFCCDRVISKSEVVANFAYLYRQRRIDNPWRKRCAVFVTLLFVRLS